MTEIVSTKRTYQAQYQQEKDLLWRFAGNNDDLQALKDIVEEVWGAEPDIRVRYLERETVVRTIDT